MFAVHEGERANVYVFNKRLYQAKCWIAWGIALGIAMVAAYTFFMVSPPLFHKDHRIPCLSEGAGRGGGGEAATHPLCSQISLSFLLPPPFLTTYCFICSMFFPFSSASLGLLYYLLNSGLPSLPVYHHPIYLQPSATSLPSLSADNDDDGDDYDGDNDNVNFIFTAQESVLVRP